MPVHLSKPLGENREWIQHLQIFHNSKYSQKPLADRHGRVSLGAQSGSHSE
jgi:hypothetical protein